MSLRFLGKVAFICNIFFLVALYLRYWQFITQQDLASHVILLGWLIAPVANIAFALVWILGKKEKNVPFPKYIGIANIVFLLIQIYLFFTLR